ncbi:MAG: hypothetical protein HQ561_03970 [Desulfobacteraceae bacterium]|nr:hypothetical protein [Desulfobacteraceae bacterium]
MSIIVQTALPLLGAAYYPVKNYISAIRISPPKEDVSKTKQADPPFSPERIKDLPSIDIRFYID